ncbi:dimethylallyl tryptophan synthase GliD1 [Xylariaceae sp. FL0255]|nr:dimethylallyl tryptophan synthase GliD1 [Xylariaceae sp. FL0255]
MNSMAQETVTKKNQSSVWEAVSRWLPLNSPDLEYWWKLTGPHVSHMMEAAGHSVEAQYNALLFHYAYIIPYLGHAPKRDGRLKWNSLLGNKGSPIEYSWKWNTTKADPDVRYCIEAIGPYAGRALDPLNQDASMEMMYRIADTVPTVDLTWTNHFVDILYDHNREKQAADGATSTILIAPEWLEKGFNLKTYFLPRRPTFGKNANGKGLLTLAEWEEHISHLDPNNKARKAMFDFLSNDPEGQSLTPYMLAVDNVKPSKSRLKLYFLGSHTSFTSVRRIMTMNGTKQVPEKYLQELRSLICAITGVSPDYPEDKELPSIKGNHTTWTKDNSGEVPDVLRHNVYYFDIAPGRTVPDIKFYIPVRDYGIKDHELAEHLINWMKSRGRGTYAGAYLDMLRYLNKYRKLEDSKGAHSYISCLIKDDGELDITSYLGAEAIVEGV